MSNDESLIYVLVSGLFSMFFSAYCRDENVIAAHSSTGHIKLKILNILVFGLEISAKTSSFSM